jgi:hypothetical protein
MASNIKSKNSGVMDEVSRGLIFEGASISQLSDIFKRDRRTVTKYLHEAGVRPSGLRDTHPVYALREAATYLCDMNPEFIDKRLATMNPQDLPPLITKEYWNGKRARLQFLREDGQLWQTDQIQMILGVWVKNFIIGVRQVTDTIDRTEKLSDQQRSALQRELDNMIDMTREHFRTALEGMKAADLKGEALSEADENDQL